MSRDPFFDELIDPEPSGSAPGGVVIADGHLVDGADTLDDDGWFARAATGHGTPAESSTVAGGMPLGSAALPLDGQLIRPPRRRLPQRGEATPAQRTPARRSRGLLFAAVLVVLLTAAVVLTRPTRGVRVVAHPVRSTPPTSAVPPALIRRPDARAVPRTINATAPARAHTSTTQKMRRRSHPPAQRAARTLSPAPLTPVRSAALAPGPTAPSPVSAPATPVVRAPVVIPERSAAPSVSRTPTCYPGDLRC